MTEPNPGYNKETPASWQENYRSMIASAEEAIARIRPGQRVFIGTGCAQPQALVKALVNRAAELEDIEIIHLLTLAEPSYGHKELAKHFHINSFFIGGNINEMQELGDSCFALVLALATVGGAKIVIKRYLLDQILQDITSGE